jgi:hypothetical protein
MKPRWFFSLAFIAVAFCAGSAVLARPMGPVFVGPITSVPEKAPSSSYGGGNAGNAIDLFGSFANRGPTPDKITGVDVKGATRIEFVVWVRGLEMPEALPLELPPNKTVMLDPQIRFLRVLVTGAPAAPGGTFPVTFHFLHAPDVTVNAEMKEK